MNRKIIISLFFLGIGVVQAAQNLPFFETPPARRRSINRPNNLIPVPTRNNYEYDIREAFVGSDSWWTKNAEILLAESTMVFGNIQYKEHWKNRLKTMDIDDYRVLSFLDKYPGEWNETINNAALRYLNVLEEHERVLNILGFCLFLFQEGEYSFEEVNRTYTSLKMNIFVLSTKLGLLEDYSDEEGSSDDEMEIDNE